MTIKRHTREEHARHAAEVNPAPCDPDVCGITGVPCPRCQADYLEKWIDGEMMREASLIEKHQPRKRK